ncbi:MAG: FAD-binding protein, partial [Culicoidibacterales bacterium]
MQHYDVLVVGGGPAGMFAAWQASLRYPRVAILEKNAV